LLYTIYQAPQSVRYLELLLTRTSEVGDHDIFVVEEAKRVTGYFHAVKRQAEYFLNYIAVDTNRQHSGLGRRLLNCYEYLGLTAGCSDFALDVFESNAPACAWYLAHGYHQVNELYHARIPLDNWDGPAPELACAASTLQAALTQEQTWGFSKIVMSGPSGSMTVGLIGGNTCKLLAFTDITLEQAASTIRRHFGTKRSLLIVSTQSSVPDQWRPVSQERVLRLTKPATPLCDIPEAYP
jgi:ribosomal protein S18 acetylase RimI-like enzyme